MKQTHTYKVKMNAASWQNIHLEFKENKLAQRSLLLFMSMGWDYVSELRPPTGLLFFPRWYMSMEHWCNDTDRWKLKNSEKNLPIATLFTTNHRGTDLGANSGLRSDRPTTNHPSHGTAWHREFWTCIWVAPGSYLSWSLVTLSKFWGFPQSWHNSTTKRPYSLLYSFQTK
jgi:hypothetical protein